jgi:hypothetical protein
MAATLYAPSCYWDRLGTDLVQQYSPSYFTANSVPIGLSNGSLATPLAGIRLPPDSNGSIPFSITIGTGLELTCCSNIVLPTSLPICYNSAILWLPGDASRTRSTANGKQWAAVGSDGQQWAAMGVWERLGTGYLVNSQ